MLTFEEKQQIIETIPELTRKDVSMKRVNYHYEESLYEKTVVVQHLHPNGNGFVYVAGIAGYDADERGLVNIRESSEEELRKIIADSIKALSEGAPEPEAVVQKFVNNDGEELILMEEQGFWNLYHGVNLEESFGDYNEADVYLIEEEFVRVEEQDDAE